MTLAEVARARLAQQRVSATTFTTPAEVVRWLLAVQAQDYRAALWAVGLRMKSATEALVERAIEARSIVRSWPMRGTLHFMAAEDARWLLELLAPRMLKRAGTRLRQLDLDARTLSKSEAVLVKALAGGKRLSRPDAYARLERSGISAEGQRGIHILFHLAHQRVLCFGPREGKQPTFVLLDEWVPKSAPRPGDEARAQLARRYFESHGPATLADFSWWTGLAATDARAALEAVKGQLEHADVDGATHWFAPPPTPLPAPPRALLLPAFDELMVGYADRTALGPDKHLRRINRGGLLGPTLLVDGRATGLWGRTLSRRGVSIEPTFLEKLPKAAAPAFAEARARYARFLGLPER
jgi:hypothetical protein